MQSTPTPAWPEDKLAALVLAGSFKTSIEEDDAEYHMLSQITQCGVAILDPLTLDRLMWHSDCSVVCPKLHHAHRLELLDPTADISESVLLIGEYGYKACSVILFDFRHMKETGRLTGAHVHNPIRALCVVPASSSSSTSPKVVSGDTSHTVVLWDPSTGRKIWDFPKPCQCTYCCSCFPDWSPSEVYIGGFTAEVLFGELLLYDVEKSVRVGSFDVTVEDETSKGDTEVLYSIVADVGRNVLISCGFNEPIRFWARDTRRCESRIVLGEDTRAEEVFANTAYSICYAEEANLLFVGGHDGRVSSYDLRNPSARVGFLEIPGEGEDADGQVWKIEQVAEDDFVAVCQYCADKQNVVAFNSLCKRRASCDSGGDPSWCLNVPRYGSSNEIRLAAEWENERVAFCIETIHKFAGKVEIRFLAVGVGFSIFEGLIIDCRRVE